MRVRIPATSPPGNDPGQVVHTRASVTKQYNMVPVQKSEKVTADYGRDVVYIVHNTGRKLTAGSRLIRNGDKHRIHKSQCCDRPMLTGGHLYTLTYKLGGRPLLLATRSVITYPGAEHCHPLASTKLYCLVTACQEIAQSCYITVTRSNLVTVHRGEGLGRQMWKNYKVKSCRLCP